MKRKVLYLLVLMVFVLAACRGAEPVASEREAGSDVVEAPVEDVVESLPAEAPEVEPTVVEEINAPETEVEVVDSTAAELVSECTLVSALPDAPDGFAEIFSVAETDWFVGPEDAAITLIEYGDFQ